MKYFPFRMLAICIILPPILYLLSVFATETYVEHVSAAAIPNIYLGKGEPLLSGAIRLEDAIRDNVDTYLRQQSFIKYGMLIRLTITSKLGKLLYPAPVEAADLVYSVNDVEQIAARNYQLLREGLTIHVEADLKPFSPISFALAGFYILLALGLLHFFYNRGLRQATAADLRLQSELSRLRMIESQAAANLGDLEKDRDRLLNQLQTTQNALAEQKQRADSTENEMINEMVMLEEQLHTNLALQEKHKKEIEALRQDITRFENAKEQGEKRRPKGNTAILKRFGALYKNISFNERALEGFLELTEDLKIKAEEVIRQLDLEPDKVVVKRKVFGKKNRKTAFEVIFGYRGRLYYSRNTTPAIEVLAIGTKHTQNSDLEFLDRM